MTIIIGILCRDGVVVGTDSSATSAAGQYRTVEQPVKKICLIDGRFVVAGTGQIGLGQRFEKIVQDASSAKRFSQSASAIVVARDLCADTIADFGKTNVEKGQYGAVLAFPLGRTVHLCEFSVVDFQPELKTPDRLWYVAMGSGQPIVDPFLGFIRSIFWKSGPPSLSEGIFVATWGLRHVIEVNPVGINGPIQMAVVEQRSDGKEPARMLSEDELLEHQQMVSEMEEHIRSYRQTLATGTATQIPQRNSPSEADPRGDDPRICV